MLKPYRKPVEFKENDLIERHIRGTGKGGTRLDSQHNCIHLKHIPTGVEVKCHKYREGNLNRIYARKMLTRKMDDLINGQVSLNALKALVIKEKQRRIIKGKKNKESKVEQKNDEENDDDLMLDDLSDDLNLSEELEDKADNNNEASTNPSTSDTFTKKLF